MKFIEDPRAVFNVARRMVDNAAQHGAVAAVAKDVEEQFKLKIPHAVIAGIMACGGTVALMDVGKAVALGALKIDDARMEELLAGAEAADAPKSDDEPEAEDRITLDAERAAKDALDRIRKLH